MKESKYRLPRADIVGITKIFWRDLVLGAGKFDEDEMFYEGTILLIKIEKLGYNSKSKGKLIHTTP